MLDNLGLLALLAVLYGIVMTFTHVVSKRRLKQREREEKARTEQSGEREQRQKRDHQFNHGGHIFKWLKEELEQYADVGIEVRHFTDNGGAYSIHIVRRHESTIRGFDDILQLSYDFVRYQEPYLGHIHYGAYGPDIRIWVGDHAPKAGLKELVLDYVAKHAEHLRRRAVA